MEKTIAQGRMEVAKGGNAQADGVTLLLHQLSRKTLYLPLPIIVFLRRKSGKSRQRFFDPRI